MIWIKIVKYHCILKLLHGTRVYEKWSWKKSSLGTRVPCNIKFIAFVPNSLATFFTTFSQLLTYLSSHVTLTKERKKWNPHLDANEKTGRIRNKIGGQQLWLKEKSETHTWKPMRKENWKNKKQNWRSTIVAERKKWNPHLEANEKTGRIRNKIGSQQLRLCEWCGETKLEVNNYGWKKKVKPTPGSQWENWKKKKQNWKSNNCGCVSGVENTR